MTQVNLPWWESMFIFAFVAAVRTYPEPAILAIFDCLDEEFADLVCASNLIALFRSDNFS